VDSGGDFNGDEGAQQAHIYVGRSMPEL
jgi:hypothetical protein